MHAVHPARRINPALSRRFEAAGRICAENPRRWPRSSVVSTYFLARALLKELNQ